MPVARRQSRQDRVELLAEIARLRHERDLLYHYIFDGHGNGDNRCAYGYPQQRGLICALCGHDNSDGSPCPKMKKDVS